MKLFLVASILLWIACEVVSAFLTGRSTEGGAHSTEAEIDELFSRTPHRSPPRFGPGEEPDCFIETCVITRKGGKCSRIRGGLSYCAVDGVLYMDNPYCDSIGRPNHSRMPRV